MVTELSDASPAEIAIWSIIALSLIVVVILLVRGNRGVHIEARDGWR